MPMVHPFKAVRYDRDNLSDVIAPPYDVLDLAGKERLLARDRYNIVAIDLPHTPPNQLGPESAYLRASERYRNWLANETLRSGTEPAIYFYRQRFVSNTGEQLDRCGACCCVEVVRMGRRTGGGVLPHEETFSGPKADRLALMRATQAQLSPIFGLHADEQGLASKLARDVMERFEPDTTANMGDGVSHETWTVTDGVIIRAYQDALRNDDVFIADGHHRYTTQLNYLSELEAAAGGPVAADHPARRCMMVLIGMHDPGLQIRPTHRVLGGMKHYSFEQFLSAAETNFQSRPVSSTLEGLERTLNQQTDPRTIAIGAVDVASGRMAMLELRSDAPLAARFPDRCAAWRRLDVVAVQHLLVEDLCQNVMNGGQALDWGYPHSLAEIGRIESAQIAFVLRPTPMSAVKAISLAGEVMPQKSTFFFPKLATGLWINPLA